MRRRASTGLLAVALSLFPACSNDTDPADPGGTARGAIVTVAGGGRSEVTEAGVHVRDADLTALAAVAVGPDGEVYVVIHDAPSFATRSTIARIEGDRIKALPGTGELRDVRDLDVAPDGSLVLVDDTLNQVLRLREGTLEVVAGDLGGKALEEPVGVDVGPDGTIYVADASGGRIGSVAPDGITAVVREGSVSVRRPGDVIVTATGIVYFEWASAVVWRVDTATGAIEGVAGDGRKGAAGDGGPASSAELVAGRLAAGPAGELYLAQGAANKVRVIGTDGVIRTLAGTGKEGFSGDGRAATEAELSEPVSVALDGRGGLLVVDFGNGRLRRIALG